jgi:uncharacterized membrane protein YuzA (DUF378 family)
MDNFLNTLSFNQNVLEYVVIFGLLALVFGTILVMFWKYIVAGLAAVFCVVVLANHKTPQPTESQPAVQPVIQQVLPAPVPEIVPVNPMQSLAPKEQILVPSTPPVVEVKPEPKQLDEHQAYLIDCMRITSYEYETCDQMWTNRDNENLQDAKYRTGKNHMVKVGSKT